MTHSLKWEILMIRSHKASIINDYGTWLNRKWFLNELIPETEIKREPGASYSKNVRSKNSTWYISIGYFFGIWSIGFSLNFYTKRQMNEATHQENPEKFGLMIELGPFYFIFNWYGKSPFEGV